jgi:hypothetical protein
MTESIFTDVKNKLQVPLDDDAFDGELLAYINAALAEVTQLGVGDADIMIMDCDDTTTWDDFFANDNAQARSLGIAYIYLMVKQLFDPPATGATNTNVTDAIRRMAWRITESAYESGA